MAWEMKEGQGSLFRNEGATSDKAPTHRGEIMIGGQVYWLSGWVRESKAGKKYLSLAAKPKPDKAPDVLPKTTGGIADMDSDLPF